MDTKKAPVNMNEIGVSYNKLRQEYAQMFRLILDLEEEKKEHLLVYDAIKPLEKERKCWRLVGGVLVERTTGEIVPDLEVHIENINKMLVSYNEALKKKEKEIFDFEREHGLKTEKLESKEEETKKTTVPGVLA